MFVGGGSPLSHSFLQAPCSPHAALDAVVTKINYRLAHRFRTIIHPPMAAGLARRCIASIAPILSGFFFVLHRRGCVLGPPDIFAAPRALPRRSSWQRAAGSRQRATGSRRAAIDTDKAPGAAPLPHCLFHPSRLEHDGAVAGRRTSARQ